jgi:hypothetical protein
MDGIIVEKIPVNRFFRRKTGFWFGMWVWNSIADKHGVKFEDFDKIPAGVLAVDAMYYGMEWYAWKKGKKSISYELMTKSLELMPAAQIKRLQDALMNSRIGGKTIMEMKESKKKQAPKS